MLDKSLFNVLLLSGSFLLIFTTAGTANYIQKVMVNSINYQYPTVEWDGWQSLCILCIVLSFSNFLVPSILALIGMKGTLFSSSFIFLVSYLVFFYPFKYELSIASSVAGFAAAAMWTAQGKCLIENSDSSNIDRNVAIFWATYEFGLVLGSLYFFLQFQGVETVTENDRIITYSGLIFIGLLGTFAMIFLKKTKKEQITETSATPSEGPVKAFIKTIRMFKTKQMILITIATLYTGLEQSFYNSVYPSAIAFTKTFGGDSVKLIGIYGMCNGFGQMVGALVFGWLGKRVFRNVSRARLFFIATIIQATTYMMVFINHPLTATVGDTYSFGIIKPNLLLAMASGFMFGLSDAILSTQLITMIGTIYSDDDVNLSSAYSCYKFVHSLGASAAFFYSSFGLNLDTHIIILIVFGFFSVNSFFFVEKSLQKEVA